MRALPPPTCLDLLVFCAEICFCAALLVSGTAQAVPVVHDIVSGFVNISVKLDGATIGYAPGVSLIGNTVTVDTAALEITGISVALEETTIILSTPFGGYDNITIEKTRVHRNL